jgi:hypothetical protein
MSDIADVWKFLIANVDFCVQFLVARHADDDSLESEFEARVHAAFPVITVTAEAVLDAREQYDPEDVVRQAGIASRYKSDWESGDLDRSPPLVTPPGTYFLDDLVCEVVYVS